MESESVKIAKMKVFRFDPSSDKKPYYDTYEVPIKYDNMTILGMLMYIYENLDPSLAFLYSCCRFSEQGKCGICDMMVNGEGAQACTFIVEEGEFVVEPPNIIGFPLIRDLVTSQFSPADRDLFFLSRANSIHRFKKAYDTFKTEGG